MRHKNTGEYRWMEDRVTPQFDQAKQVVGIFGVARDVTERKRAEEALRRTPDELQNLSLRSDGRSGDAAIRPGEAGRRDIWRGPRRHRAQAGGGGTPANRR